MKNYLRIWYECRKARREATGFYGIDFPPLNKWFRFLMRGRWAKVIIGYDAKGKAIKGWKKVK